MILDWAKETTWRKWRYMKKLNFKLKNWFSWEYEHNENNWSQQNVHVGIVVFKQSLWTVDIEKQIYGF